MGWDLGRRHKTSLGHTQLEVLMKAFHVCIHPCTTTPITCDLQNTGKWRCQLLTVDTVLLSFEDIYTCPATAEFKPLTPRQNTYFQSNSLQFSFLLFSYSHFLFPDIINIPEIIQGLERLCFSMASKILRRYTKDRLTLILIFFNSSSSHGSIAHLHSP